MNIRSKEYKILKRMAKENPKMTVGEAVRIAKTMRNVTETRTKKRDTLASRLFELMSANPDLYCGDDVHAIEVDMIFKDRGLIVTKEDIIYILGIARARRQVLKANPHLERRTGKVEELEEIDRSYFGGHDTLQKGTI